MQIEEQESVVDSFLCPSFSTYSTNKLNDIADRVTRDQNDSEVNDFEFVAFRKASDGVFFDSHSARVFPIFNREVLMEHRAGGKFSGEEDDTAAIRASFGNLLFGDQEHGPDRSTSSSSSEQEVEDEMEAVPAGSFCLWTPKPAQASSPSRCKKSNSTGSSTTTTPSKRWKLLSFLRRSNSEGKQSLVLLTPSSSSNSVKKGSKSEGSPAGVAGKKAPATVNGGGKKIPAPALEGLYVRKGEIIRRKSYFPHRRELVGFGVGLRGFPLQF